ncbi:meiosis inhibitor protein 1-like [Pyxicephalus adspersus]|uniref:meiosis inhibitor protein 1-like n=1 Tax=Pyxicephalus adspersus TaxID=30357 RepID=UPI003B59754B
MISLLHLFKALLMHQFSSPLLDIIPAKESQKTKPENKCSIKPLTTQNTLYLTTAFQNLLIQKDTFLVQAAIDCLETLIEFVYDKEVDLALHITTHPWNRFVLLLSFSCEENIFVQPGILRFMALLVKYESMKILTLDEIKHIVDEADKIKLLELPSHTMLDLQIFLQQLLNKNIAVEPSRRCIVQDLLQKIVNNQKQQDSRSTLFTDGNYFSLSPAT